MQPRSLGLALLLCSTTLAHAPKTKSRRSAKKADESCAADEPLPTWVPRKHLRRVESGRAVTQLSHRPLILHMDHLLSPSECALIIKSCAGRWRRASTMYSHEKQKKKKAGDDGGGLLTLNGGDGGAGGPVKLVKCALTNDG